jgi:carbamoyltransferase
LSLDYCFNYAGIRPADLDMIVITVQGKASSPNQDLTLNPFLQVKENGTPVKIISHHYAHAVSAYATSGFNESSILVIDGIGSPSEDMSDDETGSIVNPCDDAWEIISLYQASGTEVSSLEKHVTGGRTWLLPGQNSMPRFRSLGGIFSAAAVQIFGGDLEAGKVMGLAPYGRPVYPVDDFFRIEQGRFIFSDEMPCRFQHADRWPAHAEDYENLACSAQNALEHALLYLVEHLRGLFPSKSLCYAGGVALNSVANERIIRESEFENVYIIPSAEDSGPAIGAAYYGLWQLTSKNTRRRLLHDAVGKEYSPLAIIEAIRETPAVELIDSSDAIADAADLLIDGKILGWFQGRSELGPRALGQRSIICDPRRPDGKKVLNERVKHREAFRPFAPVVLLDEAENWFEMEGVRPDSEFMLRVCRFKEDKKALVPAVVHVDGTGRIQTACKEANGPFFDLITRFFEKTGVPIVLNTSFNIMGMPIIETPLDALLCMLSTGIDYCVLGSYLVTKRQRILLGSEINTTDAPARLDASTLRAALPPGMQTNRSQQDYVGAYHHSTGVMTIEVNDERLTATYKGQSTSLARSSHDSFEVHGDPFKGFRVSFIPDKTGFFDRVVVISANGVESVFTRERERKPANRIFMRKCAGEYELSNKVRLQVIFDDDDRFTITAPGQPHYVLLPAGDNRFDLKNTPGYCVEFIASQDGEITGAIVHQPNGEFLLRKAK